MAKMPLFPKVHTTEERVITISVKPDELREAADYLEQQMKANRAGEHLPYVIMWYRGDNLKATEVRLMYRQFD